MQVIVTQHHIIRPRSFFDFIADMFLPERFARLIPLACGGLALIGCC